MRFANEDDFELLKEMYLNEVEKHERSAIKFAEDLIFRLRTIICVANFKVIGTVSWDTRGGLSDGVIELIGLGVAKDYRKQGIGRELVLTCINEVKKFFKLEGYKLRVTYLFMERQNNEGRMFYTNIGFHEVSIIPAFYPQDDATLWIKYF
ncbi:MAG: GNAT family N-acetyltransferase [Promethearchaeota archaeon]